MSTTETNTTFFKDELSFASFLNFFFGLVFFASSLSSEEEESAFGWYTRFFEVCLLLSLSFFLNCFVSRFLGEIGCLDTNLFFSEAKKGSCGSFTSFAFETGVNSELFTSFFASNSLVVARNSSRLSSAIFEMP